MTRKSSLSFNRETAARPGACPSGGRFAREAEKQPQRRRQSGRAVDEADAPPAGKPSVRSPGGKGSQRREGDSADIANGGEIAQHPAHTAALGVLREVGKSDVVKHGKARKNQNETGPGRDHAAGKRRRAVPRAAGDGHQAERANKAKRAAQKDRAQPRNRAHSRAQGHDDPHRLFPRAKGKRRKGQENGSGVKKPVDQDMVAIEQQNPGTGKHHWLRQG